LKEAIRGLFIFLGRVAIRSINNKALVGNKIIKEAAAGNAGSSKGISF
jgi:hypothetical protein